MTSAGPRTLLSAALALSIGLLVVACSSSPTSSSSSISSPPVTSNSPAAGSRSASAQTACALVTEQEAGAAVGADPGAGKAFESRGSTQCQYGTYQTAFILVNLTPADGKAAYDLVHNNQKAGSAVDIAGVGDRAFQVSGPNTASIYFGKADALVLVSVEILTATSAPASQVLVLAKAAARRT